MFNSGFAEGSSEGPLTPRTRIESEPGILESESNLAMNEFEDSDDEEDDDAMDDSPIEVESVPQQSGALDYLATSPAENIIDDDETEEDHRNVRAKLSHPSSPRSSQLLSLSPQTSQSTPGSKMTVVVKDVAYSTYLALLYYVSEASTHRIPHFISPTFLDLHRHYCVCAAIFLLHFSTRGIAGITYVHSATNICRVPGTCDGFKEKYYPGSSYNL